jgi:hypothetical protein
MAKERSNKERRVNPDRRQGDNSSYDGPEQRGVRYRRLDIERRKKSKNEDA